MATTDIEEATLDSLAQGLTQGRFNSQTLVELYTQRIASFDKAGPLINAVIEMNPDAASIAAERDAERKAGQIRGSLDGIPVLIKDNIATADAMQSSAGSLALLGAKAPRDAFVAQRLREAGAVILGKTNLSEWANFRGQRSISGWSARGGQTLILMCWTAAPAGLPRARARPSPRISPLSV